MIFASLLAKLGFDTTAWTSGANKAKDELTSVNNHAKKTAASLKDTFGKKSMLGEMGEVLAGGGVVAGFALAARQVWELGDAWMGASKAEEEAINAASRYNSLVKAIDASRKQAAEWEYASNQRLIKSYRDLAVARNPDLKRDMDLKNQLDSVEESVNKQRQAIKDVEQERERAIERRKIAEQDLAEFERKRPKNITGNDTVNQANDWVYEKLIGGKRLEELKAVYDKEQAASVEAANKLFNMRKALAADEARLVQEKNNIIQKSDYEAEDERRKQAEKNAKERAEFEKDLVKQMRKVEIQELEGRRDELTQMVDRMKNIKDEFATQTTSEMRFGGVVQIQPKADNPMKAIAEKSLAELKGINVNLKELKKDDTVGADF